MKFTVVHTNAKSTGEHIGSVHYAGCSCINKIKDKYKYHGFYTKEFDGIHSLRDAWNYIHENEWVSNIPLCSNCWGFEAAFKQVRGTWEMENKICIT